MHSIILAHEFTNVVTSVRKLGQINKREASFLGFFKTLHSLTYTTSPCAWPGVKPHTLPLVSETL